ncbi:hypothetical protein HPB47_012841, partial [Ixodes persulcatus]
NACSTFQHDQRIVHRDIKGDNVLVNTYSGGIKITDFGTSKRLAGMNMVTETFTGTFQYMAPEVIDNGQRGYGAPADIWSLGCTVVEMATGKTPFIELGSPQAAMFKVGCFKIHPEIPSTLSEKAQKFIKRCFEPDPAKRATAAELLEDPFLTDSETSESGMRRCSSGLLSPPVDGCSTDQESGGFYLLKKDSQRRQTILRVLEEDADTASPPFCPFLGSSTSGICDIWMSKLLQDIGGDLVISKEQLQSLLNGFKSYIPEQNKTGLQHAIGKLKQEVHHDGRAIGQLGVALYLFQSAVNEVLRNQSIKPHWMFALDSLVMNAAQVASEILSPGQEDPEENELEDAESTSGVSTINSAKSPSATQKQLANLARDYALPSGEAQRVMEAIQMSEHLYQDLLRSILQNRAQQRQFVEGCIHQSRLAPAGSRESSVTISGPPSSVPSAAAGVNRPDTWRDDDLMHWLRDLGMDAECMERFAREQFTKEDVLCLMTRDDLRRLGLRLDCKPCNRVSWNLRAGEGFERSSKRACPHLDHQAMRSSGSIAIPEVPWFHSPVELSLSMLTIFETEGVDEDCEHAGSLLSRADSCSELHAERCPAVMVLLFFNVDILCSAVRRGLRML